ncbi:MAG: hypothetical protein QOH21_3658 [Acidobacteriota bacterium]|jgi:hypothetical protein|nr:hypothetical protein [Acidobacteriota bacterium]
MNSKRKADIQRRLAMASVPKPPDGLADRIKADIPQYLKAGRADRQRHFRSISLNMRVAASFLLLISALFVSIQLMSPEEEMKALRVANKGTATAVAPTASMPDLQRAISAAPQEEVQVEIAQDAPASVAVTRTTGNERDEAPADFASTRPARRQDVPSVEEAERAFTGVTEVVDTGALAGGGVSTPQPAPAPVAPPRPPSADRTVNAISVTAEAPMIAPQRAAGRLASQLTQPSTVFGISVDPEVFQRIKSTLEHGERPSADSVNIGALVNYFAGAPARKPRRNVSLEVEGSPVPVGVEGRRGVVRFTIDTPAAENAQPVAKDATIEIDINRAAVTTFRPIGVDPTASAENALAGGVSVTGLYEVELRSGISARERVATVTLRYHSVADHRERIVKKELHGRDFANAWVASSRRHRLASLGAVWGETLKGASSDTDIARRAEELATQSPEDARARELSRLAAVSSRMTGS